MFETIQRQFDDGIALRTLCRELLPPLLVEAAQLIHHSLQAGGKVLICGNGGSAADAQHFAGELVNRFEVDRQGLAAVALTHDASVITSIANDMSFDMVYARQVQALGRPGDVLIAISTSGKSPNIVKAVEAARTVGVAVIALSGKDGGALSAYSVDIHLNIPHHSTPRIQEMHITCLHIICNLIDQNYGAHT